MRTIDLVKVVRIKNLPYTPVLNLQKWFQNQHINNPKNSSQILILVEHNPVYTLGLREKLSSEETLKLSRLGAEVIKSDRGGLATFHGPGQLVAYPILHLQKLHHRPLTLRNYVSLLENLGVHTCRTFGLPAYLSGTNVSHTGAWVDDKKIYAIGVHCKRHVTTHGVALNVNVDLNWFDHIIPCGIEDKKMTSIAQELAGESLEMETVTLQFLSTFQSIFGCQLEDFREDELSQILQELEPENGKLKNKILTV